MLHVSAKEVYLEENGLILMETVGVIKSLNQQVS